MKNFTDCYEIEDWIEYYEGASRSELRSALSGVPNRSNTENKNKRKAIEALLS